MAILTKFKQKDFEKILEHYNIGKYKSHEHIDVALGNTVYSITTTKGKYILKIFEAVKHHYIDFQVKIMQYLLQNNLPLPKLILTNDDDVILNYKKSELMVQKFVKGIIPKRKASNALFKDIARNHALMNKALIKLKITGKYTWGEDYQFGKWNHKLTKFGEYNLKKESMQIAKELRKLDKTKLRKSIIHGDFHFVNLLVRNNKLVAILDLDDVHEDFLAQDIANFLAHAFSRQGVLNKEGIRLYMGEYQKYQKLNIEERKALFYFIKNRLISAAAWLANQAKNHNDLKDRVESYAKGALVNYNAFNQISLSEFEDLVNFK